LWQDTDSSARLDVENPNPGQRPGQIHYQDLTGKKYYYNPTTNEFYDSSGNAAPRSVEKLLRNPAIQKAINKALTKYLGEPPVNFP
jgi:hypothetical protein